MVQIYRTTIGIVVAGSWTTVKEQMANIYAYKLAKRGFVALAFDFRNYGESEGQPRDYEVPTMKAEDIVSAASFLKRLPFVDKENIGGLAICASAGYMTAALLDNSKAIKAVNYIAPWLHNATIVNLIYGKDGVAHRLYQASQARAKFNKTGEVEYVPAVSTTNHDAAMYGDARTFDYYLNPARGAVKEWDNLFAVMAWKEWLEFDPIRYGVNVSTPTNIVHSQAAAIPIGTGEYYSRLRGPKHITWLDNVTQFDFYDQEPITTRATSLAVDWFNIFLR